MKFVIVFFAMSIYMYAISLGQTLFEGNCVTCHQIDTEKSAPTIQKVVQVYKMRFSKKEDFVKNMAIWLIKPDTLTTLMPKKIQKYRLMPELGYDKDTLQIIAEYLYETYI